MELIVVDIHIQYKRMFCLRYDFSIFFNFDSISTISWVCLSNSVVFTCKMGSFSFKGGFKKFMFSDAVLNWITVLSVSNSLGGNCSIRDDHLFVESCIR